MQYSCFTNFALNLTPLKFRHPHTALAFFFVLVAACLFTMANVSKDSETDTRQPDASVPIHDNHFTGQARVTGTTKGFRVALSDQHGKETDHTFFNYEFYQLDTADVDRDGRTDILVGLIKSTHFDPQERKRLFILRIDQGHIRPLWLGSKVCQELVDFRTMSGGVVRTLEKTKWGNYAIGIYEWQGFGLTLIKYIHNEEHYEEARLAFNG